MSRPDAALEWLAEGFQYFVDHLSKIDDAGLDEPSALPGWTRRHVVSHLGFNARAAGRLVHWARTGMVTPMYADTTARAEEIEEGAQWSPERLRVFIHQEQEALAAGLQGLSEADWSSEVTTGQGRTVSAAELPWMRTREVWIHAVDLNSGGGFTDFPPGMIDRLVVEAVNKRRAGDAPALTVRATDRNLNGLDAGSGYASPVEGTAAGLARWLTRRETNGVRMSDDSPLPVLGPWL